VFFGTPHRGVDSAKWEKLIGNIVSTKLRRQRSDFIQTLQTNSPGLMKISEDFRPLASKYSVASFADWTF